jgi:branched-chain amino acid transport system permease protein
LGLSAFAPGWAVFILVISLAQGLVVLGLMILWRSGIISFGQSLYYAVGAYAVGLINIQFGISSALLLVLAAAAAGGVLALLLGFLLARYREIVFGMLTLAFAMILYGILVKSSTLGSTDGFSVLVPSFLGMHAAADAAQRLLSGLAAVIALLACAFVHRYLKSTAGHLATAIRDNEIRVEYLGFSVRRAIHVKFVFAGILAGAGGAIAAMAVGHIDPEMAYWTTSGEFLFVAILAGTGSVAAPFLAAVLFVVLRTYAAEYAPQIWHMVLGGALLLLILFLPDGVWSLFRRFGRRRTSP